MQKDEVNFRQVELHYIGQNSTFSFCQQLVMKCCHGRLKFEWKNHLVSDSNCNNVNIQSPQGMTNNIGLTFSVDDTIHQVTIYIEQDK